MAFCTSARFGVSLSIFALLLCGVHCGGETTTLDNTNAGGAGATGGTSNTGGTSGSNNTGGTGGTGGENKAGQSGSSGQSGTSGQGGFSGSSGSSGSAGTSGSGGTNGGTGGVAGSGGSPDNCQAIIDKISADSSGVSTCTAIVRLDYQSLEIKGYRLFCTEYGFTDEATARTTAQNDTGFGESGQLLSGTTPEDEWVFFEPPGDFGGVGVVSARSGISVFGASIVWDGLGSITYPDSFSPVSEIGPGCNSASTQKQARGFSLENGNPLTEEEITPVLDKVWSTALPDGLWKNSYLFDEMVLLYPPTVGGLNPEIAEWVVLLNSGWLE